MKVLALLITFTGLIASAPLIAPFTDIFAALPPPANGLGGIATGLVAAAPLIPPFDSALGGVVPDS
ncbi:hypothetical protein CONCODRAFT_9572 [Conidiobolus coronatus NRRL 28638]|uniref:Uncharacterized protein n=1 Tax=Conidiobolus coronatus (strain ATCC 28846 / CBS 209.66 / NRRL 28638) TaxID=796925 RepID=A0A137NZH1_CONC2|nr:hypothetical protein CONCODRAFT_9572 [Conidiobolus coronatus NRRL 28638]|eukprot:KXN68226.1 hypothetical protein CONCODRAFT_9572 [Conidiobolus coronatus NRRL 28638]